MTQDTTMGNLETWVRQLNGELNVQDIAKTRPAPIEDVVAPYSVFLRHYDKVGLCAVIFLVVSLVLFFLWEEFNG